MIEKIQAGGVKTQDKTIMFSILGMPVKPGTAGRIMSMMGHKGINLEFIAAHTVGLKGQDDIVFCVNEDQAEDVAALLDSLKQELQIEEIVRRDNVGLLFVFGPDFRYSPGIAGQIFDTLGRVNINIIAISTSIATISCVIERDQLEDAVKILHTVFETP